jgi:endonuclease/exonuclease/phosphatase family metal-dependent hydrolase
MKPLIDATLIAVLAICTQAALAQDWIRVASWNVDQLGREGEHSSPKALAEYISIAGADVLAFQEIYDNDGVTDTKTNAQLSEAFEIVNQRPGNAWEYEMLRNRREGDTNQLVVISWNKERVSKEGVARRISIDRTGSEWERHPHAIKFSAGAGKTDLVVIPLHMKADDEGDYSSQRKAEAELLVAKLDEVRAVTNDEDIVILGDLGCDDSREPALEVLTNAGFTDLNARDTRTHLRAGPLDRAFVPEEDEFLYSRLFILAPADSTAFENALSDHRMIIVPVRILDDDD